MNISKMFVAVSVTFIMGSAAAPSLAKDAGQTKGKSAEKRATKENSGRQAGQLPSGLQKYTDKKNQLPSGLQKKKDEGQLTRGLQTGGKKLKSKTSD